MKFIERLKGMQTEITARISDVLDKKISSVHPDVRNDYVLLKRYILMGGKRLRPAAFQMAFQGFKKDDRVHHAALSVEFYHTATLIFDDIMDEDDFRRGNPGVQYYLKKNFPGKKRDHEGTTFSSEKKRYAASISILIGLLSDSLSRETLFDSGFSSDKINKSLSILNSANQAVVYGQAKDISFEYKNATQDEYMDMIRMKTANLVSASIVMGAVLAGASEKSIRFLRQYGDEAAMAFQIQDDILDLSADMSKGRALGSDIMNGKQTIMVIHALKNQIPINRYLGRKDLSEKEIHEAINLLRKAGSFAYAKDIAKECILKSKVALSNVDMAHDSKEFFSGFSDFMLSRTV